MTGRRLLVLIFASPSPSSPRGCGPPTRPSPSPTSGPRSSAKTFGVNLVYLVAAHGPENMAGQIHRELGRELRGLGAGFSVFALQSEGERRAREAAPDPWAGDPFPVHRQVVASPLWLDLLNRVARPALKYERYLSGLRAFSVHLRDHPETDLVLAEGAYPFGSIAELACARSGLLFVVTVAGGHFISSDEIPSILQGMNKVAVEAAAVGTPVVLTRTTGIASALAESVAGLAVEPRRPAALADMVEAVLSDPSRRRSLGESGFRFAQRFATLRIARDLQRLCLGAIESHRGGGPLLPRELA